MYHVIVPSYPSVVAIVQVYGRALIGSKGCLLAASGRVLPGIETGHSCPIGGILLATMRLVVLVPYLYDDGMGQAS